MAGDLKVLITTAGPDRIAETLGSKATPIQLLQRPQLWLVPLTEGLLPCGDDVESPTWPRVEGFVDLTVGLAAKAAELSTHGTVMYASVEFHGGLGFHEAMVWGDRSIVLGPLFTCNHPAEAQHSGYVVVLAQGGIGDMEVNVARRFLGVDRGSEIDEFAAAGLDRYRWTTQWAEAAGTAQQ